MTTQTQHATTADTLPSEGSPGGTWSVGCTCGWARVGRYARDGGEAVALRLADLFGMRHEKNPEEKL